ncbi:MAG TPA: hybrid sensor histidine kinase/response regulator [Cyanobacteria bacterium UBA11149]|nr:hybrid sensor histidine kinase/response regulator [Cyanobacteria bacterium UBA11367]HBE57410.1 hybrid sensor histidine kinase/response regulator [Cyanobacteria bacterium UBA11366]HBK64611.1 hybrid sensor histidine kinase/response regulator [Cyanobacteria bacterium UBA11166]HBR77103.1 hybrid sensor histidine kinase/response regulator [Cyanobacteria bacterium UBA11159]HBS68554.1 hybrid sensor histidine kinase/response regulator [Cyanobacteria bacterium UBA11153]HBW92494.1 hybrid sensor histid
MLQFWPIFLGDNFFIPHGHCYLWESELMWLHIISDSLIFLAYYSIPITLIYFVQKRKDLPFDWIFLLFGGFIISCGTTHIIEIWTLWHPIYWISGALKAFTAGISILTAILLVAIIPKALAVPSPSQLEAANRELEKAKIELERRVEERTGQIREAMAQLENEIKERNQIEGALQESQDWLKAIAEANPHIFYIYDLIEQRNVYTNKAISAMLGYTPGEIEEMESALLPNLIHPDDLTGVSKDLGRFDTALDGEILENEYRMRHKNGEWRWFYCRETIFKRTSDGKPWQIVGTETDITERKNQTEALRKIAEGTASATGNYFMYACVRYLAKVLQVNYALIAEVIDEDCTKARTLAFWMNGTWAKNFEYDLIGTPCHNVIQAGNSFYPHNLLSLFPNNPDFVKLGAESYFGIPLIQYNGKIVGSLVVMDLKPMNWDPNKDAILKIFADRAAAELERKKGEEALKESELLEREKAQALEQTLAELKLTQARLIQSEKMSSLGEMVAGIAHEINNPVTFIASNINYVDGYFQDLLGLIKLYQNTYPDGTPEIHKRLEDIELNFLVEDWSKIKNSMKVGTSRIAEIVRSLRSFSRLDESEIKAVNINESIENTLRILQHRLKGVGNRSSIQVIKNYGKIPLLTCYSSQLNQVFLNLINNAIDALEKQSSPRIIKISTSVSNGVVGMVELPLEIGDNGKQYSEIGEERDGIDSRNLALSDSDSHPSIFIRITDNGHGIREKVRDQIFNPFFTTKPVGTGRGLGLSISYQIVVNRHGGEIQFYSVENQGTEFTIILPIFPH